LKLKDVCQINQGILSGADSVTDNHKKKYKVQEDKGDGIFVLDINNPKDKDLIEHLNPMEKSILHPFYKNSDIKKFYFQPEISKFVLYITKNVDIKQYPNIKKHLLKFKSILTARLETYKEKYQWYCLHRERKQEIFEKTKIVCSRRSKSNIFALETEKRYEQSDITIITSDIYDPVLLLGILNSSLIELWLKNKGKRKGELLELYYEPLSEIPIPKIDKHDKNSLALSIITTTNSILENKKISPETSTKVLESQINKLVYQLYDLTEEEIKIVENEIHKSASKDKELSLAS
jgi:adenine-specific DNA-methyltransferase